MPLRGFANIAMGITCEARYTADTMGKDPFDDRVERGQWLKHAVHSATYARRWYGGHSQITGKMVGRWWGVQAIFNWYL